MPRFGKSTRGRRPHQPAEADPAEAALIFFAKAPIPGEVKTRMCPPLTPEEAASLHGSLVMDALEQTSGLCGWDRYVACLPSRDHPFFQTIAARHRIQLCNQSGAELGQRMEQAFTTLFTARYQYAVLVGTDIPTLSSHTYTHAKELLHANDVVFGPTQDGGYYLIGMKQPTPALFATIPWSTDQVFALSHTRAAQHGLSIGLLAMARDLDTYADLHAVLKETPAGPGRPLSARTATVVRHLLHRHGAMRDGASPW